jgi:hypothetical protein
MSITSTLVHRAEIRFYEAADTLRPYVGCFWVVTAERNATLHIVPDGSTAISIELQNGRPAGWCLRGPLVRPEQRRFPAPATLVGVRLRPGVAFILTRIAAHAMVARRIRLNATAAFRELVCGESHLQTPAQCIDVLQHFLIERLTNANVHDVVARALHEIQVAHASLQQAHFDLKQAQSRIPMRRFGKPEEVAAAVRFMASPEAGYITGSTLKIDGGIL